MLRRAAVADLDAAPAPHEGRLLEGAGPSEPVVELQRFVDRLYLRGASAALH
jgi:hypothetical protein